MIQKNIVCENQSEPLIASLDFLILSSILHFLMGSFQPYQFLPSPLKEQVCSSSPAGGARINLLRPGVGKSRQKNATKLLNKVHKIETRPNTMEHGSISIDGRDVPSHGQRVEETRQIHRSGKYEFDLKSCDRMDWRGRRRGQRWMAQSGGKQNPRNITSCSCSCLLNKEKADSIMSFHDGEVHTFGVRFGRAYSFCLQRCVGSQYY